MTRRLSVLLLMVVCGAAVPAAARAANAVQTENAKPGTTDWKLTNPGYATGVIEGYASLTSVNRGGQIRLFVHTVEPTYTLDIFRLGHYGGLGARRVLGPITRTGTAQVMPTPDPVTGLIECAWINPYVLNIPNSSDPTDWMTGIYLAKLTAGTSGKQQYIVFVVRDDSRSTDLIMAETVTTYQAYNVWGGKSLYGTIASRTDAVNRARKVSFDRPYYGDQSSGASDLLTWEAPMLRWLEANGYDVTYATNVDVHRDPNLLLTHKAFLSVGHDEYWSWDMRDHVEAARDRGVSLGFFSGNTAYWQVRFEPSTLAGAADRVIAGYKEDVRNDPLWPTDRSTTRFRDSPVNRPEHGMMGVGVITQARPIFVVEDASHWVFTGTGLKNGDRLANLDGSSFLGYEVDAMGPASPAGTRRLAHSPVNAAAANFADMVIDTAASGATVFSSGSIGWSQTVPQIAQITRNVLARLVSGAFSDQPPVRDPLPPPLLAKDIGDVGRAGFVTMPGADSFTLNGGGGDAGGSDALYFAYQTLSGDGTVIAQLATLQLYWDNRAGIMIRESLAPTARYVALVGRPSESRRVGTSGVNEGVELWIKDQAGVKRRIAASLDQKLPNWLKLVRTADSFAAYASADGAAWTLVGTATAPMAASAYAGAEVDSAQYGVWATARFENVSVTPGGGPAPGPPPPPPATLSLPSGWTSADIGAVGTARGSAAYDPAVSVFTLQGGGADIWGTADAFHYAYTTMQGDGRLEARVTAVENAAPWTKAGVMIRNSLEAGSAHALMLLSAGKGAAFQRRTVAGGLSTSTSGGLLAAPRWVRLDRSGSTVTASLSADGAAWTVVGSDTIPIQATVYVGLAVSSHLATTTATAAFDRVRVTPAAAPAVCADPAASNYNGGAPCVYPAACTVTTGAFSFFAGAGTTGVAATWFISATAGASCQWVMTADADWLEIKDPVTGVYRHGVPVAFTGPASVKVHALANAGPKRVGHFSVGGVVYTVTQEGP